MVDIALTIAGNEATGGAGAAADLKTFQQLGVFGLQNLTCIVSFDANNNFNHIFVPIAPETISDQLNAAFNTYDIETAKIGMLGTIPTIETVAKHLNGKPVKKLVVDPVLICKGQEPGAALDIDNALKQHIVPLAYLITPNHFEAESLSGIKINNVEDMKEAAKKIVELGPKNVLVKGGVEIEGEKAVDVFYDGDKLEVLEHDKVGNERVSGAGCTLAAAITAELAKGATSLEACKTAKEFVHTAIKNRVSSKAPFDAVWQGGK
ncbi:MAG: bifunctional hydroxymethylpyrimidine kinase/phosphomethylpyrimidine kinase [Micrococcaceae bacterium]